MLDAPLHAALAASLAATFATAGRCTRPRARLSAPAVGESRCRGIRLWMALVLLLPPALHAETAPTEIPEPMSDTAHHTSNGFRNTHAAPANNSLLGILRARFGGNWKTYNKQTDRVPTTTPQLASADSNTPRVTWLGHATVLIQHQGINVLTDPVFSKYASPVQFAGPARITQPALGIDALPTIHAVVISHDHYDHLDKGSIRSLGNAPLYFVPKGIARWLKKQGIKADRIKELDWWDSATLDVNGRALSATATPAQHFSGRGLTDRNATLWCSWALQFDDFRIWFGGDTGYNDVQFKDIGARLPDIDLGIIPIGAYEPRWFMGTVHVNPEEAVQIHRDIGARASMGIHWGAFVLAGEGVMTPPVDLAAARVSHNVSEDEFSVFAVGESRDYPIVRGAQSARPESSVKAGEP